MANQEVLLNSMIKLCQEVIIGLNNKICDLEHRVETLEQASGTKTKRKFSTRAFIVPDFQKIKRNNTKAE